MLESVCKIYSRRWHLNGDSYSTRHLHLSQLFRFKLFKLESNIFIWVNLMEIRFYAYFYTPTSLVLWHIMFDTTAQILEVEFGGKYGYLKANNQHWLPAIIGHVKTNILQQNMWWSVITMPPSFMPLLLDVMGITFHPCLSIPHVARCHGHYISPMSVHPTCC